jgi:hypothetical protein
LRKQIIGDEEDINEARSEEPVDFREASIAETVRFFS